ncbi:fungal-specific transcription factor domain-containing protein [Corynascus novoguineensis]|uniref:Fungal-specific transcription factor domain-containing protein n=1 Tax=Corynascus novoguineensis TaxID=1126955 RepID=A0AAN7HNP2_9PEZI|nr:fungal-specific transcription factor domain-containing protein [Corynascus novoguineensis]
MATERRSERVEQRRRRKIPLACEPCRERKSRCDGAKPICSTCQRRSLSLHHCIYTLENARTASNEAYIKVLHDRIRRLEKTCTEHGVPIPPLDSTEAEDASGPPTLSPTPLHPGKRQSEPSLPIPSPVQGLRDHASPPNLRLQVTVTSPDHERLDATESTASVTAMGTVTTEHDVSQAFETANEFYGSSSAASFMKEAYTSVKPHRPGHHENYSTNVPAFSVNLSRSDLPETAQFAQADKFALPPRNLADHLLSRFWERVYWLYPFFDKATFLRAYESLWRPSHEQSTERSLPGIGLGSSPGADAGTIVFHCALNTIFALGAQFSDLSLKDKASAIETFFNRAKAFVGLDFIDMHNVGVVQSLLLMALLLQSTPFPSRCWNAVGLACRVAQGLGLHTETERTTRPPLETEIRRRTWHGCVILDIMTYGRPTMTAHLPDLPLPSTVEFGETLGSPQSQAATQEGPSKMCFYVEYIRQCRILGEILSNVYQPSAGGTASGPPSWFDQKSRGMDAILELDAKLSRYETELPPIMSWTSPCDISYLDKDRQLVITTQRTVLRGSFLYLRLMLHRPILTQLCANTESNPATEPSSPTRQGTTTAGQELFTSFAAGCAKICLGAAIDLIELVHSTYLTNTTGGWWWDGLYAFTAGLAVIVGYLSPPLLASLPDTHRLERSWMLCQGILAHFTSFSISAQRSLRLLQKVHADVMTRSSGTMDKDQDPPLRPPTKPMTAAHGETAGSGGQAPMMQADEVPLDLGSGFQLQMPAGTDMHGAGLAFNWDQSLDMIPGGLGWVFTSDLG